MFTIVTEAREIKKANQAFRNQLLQAATSRVSHRVGYPSGSSDARIAVFRELSFYFALFEVENDSRWWNGFGVVMPDERRVLPLVVEVNVPYVGVDRRVSGVVLKDQAGSSYVAHRGKIGGGAKGVGKTLFWGTFGAEGLLINDKEWVLLLGRIGDPKLITNLATFIHRVDEIKRRARGWDADSETEGDEDATEPEPSYNQEFAGTKRYTMSQVIEARCTHGTVVRHLHEALKAGGWTRLGNDKARDLFALPTAGLTSVTFEVKTDTSTQSIYTGVGQLVMHARPKATKGRAVLVVPSTLSAEGETLLAAEGFEVLRYSWPDDTRVEFDGLDRLSARLGRRG